MTATFIYAIYAIRDGITFIVDVEEFDKDNKATGTKWVIEGVVADSEEDAISKISAEIAYQAFLNEMSQQGKPGLN